MSDATSPTEEPEESGSPPPDADMPGMVDYPDPAFDDDEDQDETDIESPDDGEPDDGETDDDDQPADDEPKVAELDGDYSDA